jgi:hypothetical protein
MKPFPLFRAMKRPGPLVLVLATASLAMAALAPAPVAAQVIPQDTAEIRRMAEQRFGSGVTQDEVLRQLRASGMTRA